MVLYMCSGVECVCATLSATQQAKVAGSIPTVVSRFFQLAGVDMHSE